MAIIVVVDDEPIVLELVAMVLRLGGHDLKELADPLAAHEAIVAARPAVDLIITDAGLKPITGFELVNRLRSHAIGCPVLIISGQLGAALLTTDTQRPIAILEKPFTAAALRTAVDQLLTTDHAASM